MKAYLAGGCFWCMEKPYHTVEGVLSAESGYCGGTEAAPAYEDVKAQRTGHRETVCVEYDEQRLPFPALLDVYFENIDPFDAGGQFIDRGHSYTCAVYYTDEGQRASAERAFRAASERAGRPVCVSVEPFAAFYPAEEYHQDYADKNPEAFARELEESGRAAFLRAKEER